MSVLCWFKKGFEDDSWKYREICKAMPWGSRARPGAANLLVRLFMSWEVPYSQHLHSRDHTAPARPSQERAGCSQGPRLPGARRDSAPELRRSGGDILGTDSPAAGLLPAAESTGPGAPSAPVPPAPCSRELLRHKSYTPAAAHTRR